MTFRLMARMSQSHFYHSRSSASRDSLKRSVPEICRRVSGHLPTLLPPTVDAKHGSPLKEKEGITCSEPRMRDPVDSECHK